MIPSEAYDLPRIGCLPGSFPKVNFIKDWNGPALRWLESSARTVPPDVTFPRSDRVTQCHN